MEKKKTAVFNFRPTQKNRDWFEKLTELDLNVSEIVNEALENHFPEYATKAMKNQAKKLSEALSSR